MMKILFFSLIMFYMPTGIMVLSCAYVIMILLMILNINNINNYYMLMNSDMISISLMILSVYIMILMFMSQFNFKFLKSLFLMFNMLNMSLILSFSTNNMLLFYFFFEWSLIPIFFIIIGWGYQLERLKSSFYLLMYTLFASLPLLIMLLMLSHFYKSNTINFMILMDYSFIYNIYTMMFFMAFLVKFPMFFFHQWLPKAHVEAPVGGSMILAGVLLKLGGYGMMRLLFFMNINYFIKTVMIFSLMGGSFLSIVCLMNSDVKVLIAYSSVVHMAFIIMNLFSKNYFNVNGSMMMMLAHGICSSGMFSCANMMYERSHSRMIMMNKSMLNYFPSVSMFWFVLCMANFSGPFTYNLLSEVMLVISLSLVNWLFIIFVSFISFFSAAYSMILYSNMQQGINNNLIYFMKNFNFREMLILFSHCFIIIFLLFSSSMI